MDVEHKYGHAYLFEVFTKLSKADRMEAITMLINCIDSVREIELILNVIDLHVSEAATNAPTKIATKEEELDGIHCDKFSASTSKMGKKGNAPSEKFLKQEAKKQRKSVQSKSISEDKEMAKCEKRNKRKQNSQYSCNICDKSYKYDINKHQRVHMATVKKSFACNLCEKSFKAKRVLKLHTVTHTGVKPHKCDECPKAFIQKSNLQIHKRIHSGIKPFKCDECNRTFTQLSHLLQHKRMHNGIKPFSCEQCDSSFTQLANLQTHIKVHLVKSEINQTQ